IVSESELAQPVQLVLLPMLQAVKKPIPEGRLHSEPRIRGCVRRTPTSDGIHVAVVARDLYEAVESESRNVGRCESDSIVALPNIKRPAVHTHCFNGCRDKKIRIGIPVPVCVCGQVVGIKKVADLEKLSYWLAVISRNTGREILRSLDASRCSLDR